MRGISGAGAIYPQSPLTRCTRPSEPSNHGYSNLLLHRLWMICPPQNFCCGLYMEYYWCLYSGWHIIHHSSLFYVHVLVLIQFEHQFNSNIVSFCSTPLITAVRKQLRYNRETSDRFHCCKAK